MMSQQMTQPLHITTDAHGVCRLTLNRPQYANALDGDLIHQLLSVIVQLRSDPALRLLILSGRGDFFSSGADLHWMQQMAAADEKTNHTDALELALLLEELASLPVPTLARVNGPAYGGAIGLIAACDIAIASSSASFTCSEVRLGLIPAVIAPYVIAAIGQRQARRWFLTGKTFEATLAQQMGLVHQLVLPDELDEAVEHETQTLLKGGPQAQAQVKQLTNEWLSMSPLSSEDTARLLAEVRASGEGREGLAAFIEKRKPEWLK